MPSQWRGVYSRISLDLPLVYPVQPKSTRRNDAHPHRCNRSDRPYLRLCRLPRPPTSPCHLFLHYISNQHLYVPLLHLLLSWNLSVHLLVVFNSFRRSLCMSSSLIIIDWKNWWIFLYFPFPFPQWPFSGIVSWSNKNLWNLETRLWIFSSK